MKIEDLTPDIALAVLLDRKIKVCTSATESHAIRVYADEQRPNKDLADEFVDVDLNGPVRSLTENPEVFGGDIMLSICCRTQTDGRAKRKLVRQIASQIAGLAHGISTQGFFFRIDPTEVITPTTVNLTTGYSTTVINVEWHVTDEFLKQDNQQLKP